VNKTLSKQNQYDPRSAAAHGKALCHDCGNLSDATERKCSFCNATIHTRKPKSIQRTFALLITAIILYIPANTLPIMTTNQFGNPIESTIIGGILLLMEQGSSGIALIIFIASVLVPIAKILMLLWLCFLSTIGARFSQPTHAKLHGVTEIIGRWSMLDVCVVAILVALVQLGGLIQVTPGPAGLAFAGVVIATMIAATTFDPRLIWDAHYRQTLKNNG